MCLKPASTFNEITQLMDLIVVCVTTYMHLFFRWVAILCITILFLITELNTFYLKFVLWVPPNHILNPIRLLFILLWGAVCKYKLTIVVLLVDVLLVFSMYVLTFMAAIVFLEIERLN